MVRSVSELQMPRLGGTKITSTKDVAVTVGDDSMFPQDFTVNNDCEDYAGDQIVPTSIIGKEYWVVKGQGYKLGTTGTSAGKDIPNMHLLRQRKIILKFLLMVVVYNL